MLVVTRMSEVIWHVQIHAKLSEYLHRSGCRNTPESGLLPGSIHVRWIFVLFSENIADFALRMVPRAFALRSSPLRLSSHSDRTPQHLVSWKPQIMASSLHPAADSQQPRTSTEQPAAEHSQLAEAHSQQNRCFQSQVCMYTAGLVGP